jgi:hypothetical protein
MGVMSGLPAAFRVTYAKYGELKDDLAEQMARGGLLVKVYDTPGLDFDSSVALELVMPDGTTLTGAGKVLQIFAGFGVAVTVEAQLVEQVSKIASRPEVSATGTARHERVDLPPWLSAPPPLRPGQRRAGATQPLTPLSRSAHRSQASITPPISRSAPLFDPPMGAPLGTQPPTRTKPPTAPPLFAELPRPRPPTPAPPISDLLSELPAPSPAHSHPRPGSSPPVAEPPRFDKLSRIEKVQKALHGTRDERNAILRDRDRTLYPFVLKNPQLDADDVVAIAKNAQMTADMLTQIADRKEWLQRPSVALALARNPRTPTELAVRALEHVPTEALRQLAKGNGALPHVVQAARKKLIG